jgi:Cytochrome P460
MKSKYIPSIVVVAVLLAVLGSMAFAAQDGYTLKLGKLAFSDFRGYENWKVIAVSQTETLLKVIVANDVPADGKFFPEGSKIVKIEWTAKKNTASPYFVMVPDTLKAVATTEKDTKRSRTRTDGHTAILTMMPRLTRLRLRGTMPSAGTRAIRR